MKILIACEFSGIIRDAFAAKGHDVTSCDLLPTERPGKHYQGLVQEILYPENYLPNYKTSELIGHEKWDMIIANVPCDYSANSGVRWLYEISGRWELMEKGCEFFNVFLDHPCSKICVENPIIHGYARKLLRRNYSQLIQPYQFGHTTTKATCLWLKGLPPLMPTKIIPKQQRTDEIHKEPPGKNRKKNRSRTFQGIAKAMANQWS